MTRGSVVQASIVFTDIDDFPLFMGGVGTLYKSYGIDINRDGFDDAIFRSSEADFQVVSTTTSWIASRPPRPPNIGNFAATVHFGEPIGITLGSPWSWNSGTSFLIGCVDIGCLGYWGDNIDYIGVQFAIDGSLHYGWVEVEVPFIGINGGYVRSYAYETEPGIPIVAGTVPEPTVATFLCFGLTLAITMRQRRSSHRAPLS